MDIQIRLIEKIRQAAQQDVDERRPPDAYRHNIPKETLAAMTYDVAYEHCARALVSPP